MSDMSLIDHLVIAGPDLGRLSRWWAEAAGHPATPGGAHTGRGTRNELVGIDASTYIELIGPDPDQPEHSGPRPFGIDELNEITLVTFAMAVADLEAATIAVRSEGVDPGPIHAMERMRPGGVLLSWRLAVPPDPEWAGVMPFLIEWGPDTPHPAGDLAPACSLDGLRLRHPEAHRIAATIRSATGTELEVETGAPLLAVTFTTPAGPVAV